MYTIARICAVVRARRFRPNLQLALYPKSRVGSVSLHETTQARQAVEMKGARVTLLRETEGEGVWGNYPRINDLQMGVAQLFTRISYDFS